LCGCAAAAGILAFIIYIHAIIIATAFLGAYLMVRGVSCYAGHYENEFTMAEKIKSGVEIDPYYWCYVAGFAVMLLVGLCVQYRAKKKQDEEDWDKEHGQ
jgi:hypothetical protein